MSKEEYAQLWYLLGKLKYAISEDMINNHSSILRNEEKRVLDGIDAITKICIIDEDDKKTSIN